MRLIRQVSNIMHGRNDTSSRSLRGTVCLVLQERDGFREQVESLRDKVSELSRELAECQEKEQQQGGRLEALEATIQNVRESLIATEGELEREREAREAQQKELKKARSSWKTERAQLVSDRDGYKGQVEALRDKVRFSLAQCTHEFEVLSITLYILFLNCSIRPHDGGLHRAAGFCRVALKLEGIGRTCCVFPLNLTTARTLW
jgi:chromosome segregation ATPase